MLWATAAAGAAIPAALPVSDVGPYNAVFLKGGVGISQPLAPESPLSKPAAPWSVQGWVRIDVAPVQPVIVATLGDPSDSKSHVLTLEQSGVALRVTPTVTLRETVRLLVGDWHALAATYDGSTAHLYIDGREVASKPAATDPQRNVISLAPESTEDLTGSRHFGGALAHFAFLVRALTSDEIRAFAMQRPDFSLVAFDSIGVGWPWQEHAWRGLLAPQPAWTLPQAKAPPQQPRVSLPAVDRSLRALDAQTWRVEGWRLASVEHLSVEGEDISRDGFDDQGWYAAIVPGTVLSTLIANGVYPDPDYGLNNLAIPESLSHSDYWYRTTFQLPKSQGRRFALLLNGVNYAAEVWLNGRRVGTTRGAFIRGDFDVTEMLHEGMNALAVRVAPPPHPGIAHEQSVAAGPGENGGNLALDGPTFIATEGWDWIPGIRDRNTGLWQDVQLHAVGAVRLLDPQVRTQLPLPKLDSADVRLLVPVENQQAQGVRALIEAAFGDVKVRREVLLPPGVTEVRFEPSEFPALHLAHPRLWWPNGYGEPALYTLELSVRSDGVQSDQRSLRFGIRELTYELSLFDHAGRLRRVEVDPTAAVTPLVDVRHAAIKRTANGWAASLTAAAESSSAVREVATTSLTPYLVIRVNGIPIAVRGGSWGMDDSRKRSSREHLEPFFRLHREAHLNIIRNWLGQNTEETFYELADEYGLLVLNDFWESTQDFQLEAEDPQLFLKNAADVIRHYRNHPSIALWFGRNEGVPQPILNEGLADLVARLDGTRYYTGSSNRVNLQDSGPYSYRTPEQYFTTLAQGFAVELGTPSLASLETLESYIPAADRWPLADTYAYHDWHFGGNGDTAGYMDVLAKSLGPATSLADFERKAQLMQYVAYRAIFEGFQAHLWTRNSGRMLWMTHPAWPSNTWQIYSSDYDAAAAYYAVAKACEPLHAQLDLPDYRPAVVNTTRTAMSGLVLQSEILDLRGHPLSTVTATVEAAANAVTTLPPLKLSAVLLHEKLVFVRLTLRDVHGQVLSRNLYWQGLNDEAQRLLAELPAASVSLGATMRAEGDEHVIRVQMSNHNATPLLMIRLMALDANGARVLPAYYSDNYLTLLPGESQAVTVRCPDRGGRCARLAVRGWNVTAAESVINTTPHDSH